MKNIIKTLLILLAIIQLASSEKVNALQEPPSKDTPSQQLSMDAIYTRPFLTFEKLPVSLGGYVEVNWQHLATDGISEGHQLQIRRMTLFTASTISTMIKFLSEIEFEEGGKEIAIEFASVDIEFSPYIILRSGVVMNPIGTFNQNHDGPKWEFIDRPIASTQLLPATWSNAGFGLYGKYYFQGWTVGYELYATGGFDDSIIENSENKTFLPASKNNVERFEEIASGKPFITSKIATRSDTFGELGFSYMGGVYNKFQEEGIMLDKKRRCDVVAVDYATVIPILGTSIKSEWAWISVDVPETYTQQFGNKQQGGFIDLVQPVLERKIRTWEEAVFIVSARLEYIDWNIGTFNETKKTIFDDLWSISIAMSFRPTSQTVLRLNYRHQEQRDLLGNPPALTGGFSFGLSSYF